MPAKIPAPKLKSRKLEAARLIWQKAQASAVAFIKTFEEKRSGKTAGTSSDAEQDLLRAAVVFSGAGLDAVVKQLLRDAGEALLTPAFLDSSDGKPLLREVSRRLRVSAPEEDADAPGEGKTRLLARAILSGSPRSVVCQDLIGAVTGDSLQSVEQLSRVCGLFGLSRSECVQPREAELRSALGTRNEIVHEMDIDLGIANRKRRPRRRDEVTVHVRILLETAKRFLETADKRLGKA